MLSSNHLIMSKIKKLFKALSGTVSWSLPYFKFPGPVKEPPSKKAKQDDKDNTDFNNALPNQNLS
jgi:hypothetical protein